MSKKYVLLLDECQVTSVPPAEMAFAIGLAGKIGSEFGSLAKNLKLDFELMRFRVTMPSGADVKFRLKEAP